MICLDVFLNENIKKAVGDGNMKEYEKIGDAANLLI